MFLKWFNTTTWITDVLQKCSDVKLRNKASSLYFRTMARWRSMLGVDSSEETEKTSGTEPLLSIIIPTHNIEDFLPGLQRNLEQLKVSAQRIYSIAIVLAVYCSCFSLSL